MTIPQTEQIINLLRHKGVSFDDGLSNLEILQIHEKFDVQFPPDLKQFLQLQLPTSDKFINWRQGLVNEQATERICHMLNWTWKGILYNIEKYNFWVESWGEKPDDYESKIKIAKAHYDSYPKLVPIYGHRFIPSRPDKMGNPIFSVVDLDIIYYGYDLATYFANEFYFKLNESFKLINKPNRKIEFWSWCVDRNSGLTTTTTGNTNLLL